MDTADQKLLKSTGAGNLVMVCGEPGDDSTTGEIRSDSTDEIACWFIDPDCNEGRGASRRRPPQGISPMVVGGWIKVARRRLADHLRRQRRVDGESPGLETL